MIRIKPDDSTVFAIHNVSRRVFLKQLGIAGSGLVLGVTACSSDEDTSPTEGMPGMDDSPTSADTMAEPASFTDIGTFVSIGDDGSVQLVTNRSEMGQGVRTSIAMVLAEELCVDFDDVIVSQAAGHPRFGDQNTDSSRSIRTQYAPMRRAGAAAREMLLAAAATMLEVDASELRAESGMVIHEGSDRRVGYAELAPMAAELAVPESPALKDPSDFTIIGKRTQGVDARDITRGKAVYGYDVEIEGMLVASIERSPTVGGTVMSYDEAAAMAVDGVRHVVELTGDGQMTNNAVAVVADNTWAALQGRRALDVQWDPGTDLENTPDYRASLQAAVMAPAEMPARQEGDFAAAESSAATVVEAVYRSPYVVHAPMEPPVAVAKVDGDTAEVWAPVQDPQRARGAAAAVLGLMPEQHDNVTMHVTLLGGAFGRKSQPDFVIEAVALAKEVGAPVKVQWTREDEIRHGFYRPEAFQLLRATLDESGAVTGWMGRTAFQTVTKAVLSSLVAPGAFELDMGWTNVPFDIPNVQLEAAGVANGVRTGWWRSVGNTFHAFAVSSFVDELAQAIGQDTVSVYKQLLGPPRELPNNDSPFEAATGDYVYETGRMAAVVDEVTRMGLWGSTVPEGEGIGFAAHMSFRSYAAMTMHVRVDADKKLHVLEVDCAIDCGTVVNPDGVEAQVEGGVVYGLTAALFSEITVENGAVVQGNFDTYPMLRMDRMPKVNVSIVNSDKPPTGVGEPPTPPVAPALANAVYAATGERIRELPFTLHGFS